MLTTVVSGAGEFAQDVLRLVGIGSCEVGLDDRAHPLLAADLGRGGDPGPCRPRLSSHRATSSSRLEEGEDDAPNPLPFQFLDRNQHRPLRSGGAVARKELDEAVGHQGVVALPGWCRPGMPE